MFHKDDRYTDPERREKSAPPAKKETIISVLILTVSIILVIVSAVNKANREVARRQQFAQEVAQIHDDYASIADALETFEFPTAPEVLLPSAEVPEVPAAPEQGTDFTPDFTFAVPDMDGQIITEAIFSENELTMINFWEPWCGPCVAEMPELEALYQDYRSRGLLILGIYSTTDMAEDAAQIVLDSGVTYPIAEYCEAFSPFQTGYVPTTIFVDRHGHIVGQTQIGSNSYEGWAAIVEALL